jgi:hypothetical protein
MHTLERAKPVRCCLGHKKSAARIELLRRALKDFAKREEVVIATKVQWDALPVRSPRRCSSTLR